VKSVITREYLYYFFKSISRLGLVSGGFWWDRRFRLSRPLAGDSFPRSDVAARLEWLRGAGGLRLPMWRFFHTFTGNWPTKS
jgi:hypothetical protein